MADSLKQLGRQLGNTQSDVEFLKRRGGLLPAIDRTRGTSNTTVTYTAPFVVNELNRKVSLSLHFSEVTPRGCDCRPQAAQASFVPGDAHFAIPQLPWDTTPGHTLIAFIAMASHSDLSAPPAPNFSDLFGGGSWTQLGWQTLNDISQFPGPGAPIGVGIWTRSVGATEITTTPTTVSTSSPWSIGVWLYEMATDAPTLASTFSAVVPQGGTATLAGGSGLTAGIFAAQWVDYGNLPTMSAVSGTKATASDLRNNPNTGAHGWIPATVYIGSDTGGGSVAASFNSNDGGLPNEYAVVGYSVSIPGLKRFPAIPYPTNQVA